MGENAVGKLVSRAKGEDRSIREYAKDSGVDAAIISKIINGYYIPKKTDIYVKLTSVEASPRGGVTLEQLIEASNPSKEYQEGVETGKKIAEAILATSGGLALMATPFGAMSIGAATAFIAGKKTILQMKKNKTEDIVNEIQRYVAISKGLILAKLAAKGIMFRLIDKRNNELENQFDTYIKLEGQSIKEYIFRYVFLSKEDQKHEFLIKNTPKRVIEELVFLKPSNTRKVTLVLNADAAYEYMLSFKDKLAYNGELSILLLDEKCACLRKEDYISHYVGKNSPKEMYIV